MRDLTNLGSGVLRVMVVFSVLFFAAGPVFAQTPETQPPPEVTEPVVTEPPVTEPPVTEPPVTEPPVTEPPVTEPPVTEPVVTEPTVTETPTTEPEVTETPTTEPEATETQVPVPEETESPDSSSTPDAETPALPAETPESTPAANGEDLPGTPEPTSTEEIVEPDQLIVVGDAVLSLGAGESRDIVVSYTLGSDRVGTEVTADMSLVSGDSLDGWSVSPVDRVDLADDPEDINREFAAKVRVGDVTLRGEVFDVTFRVTAPEHIESPVSIALNVASSIQSNDAATPGVSLPALVVVNGLASEHSPLMQCDAAIAEEAENAWNCSLETDHPGSDVVVSAKLAVPDGWEMSLNGADVGADPQTLVVDEAGLVEFAIAADYPIGCPDPNAEFTARLSVELSYPSGELITRNTELALSFERPIPTFEITAFEFDDFDMRQTLTTTGRVSVAYESAPCAWQSTFEFTDFQAAEFTIPDVAMSVTSVDGLPASSVTIFDNAITVGSPETTASDDGGVFTINLSITLPSQVPPGSYQIGVNSVFIWQDEL